MGTYDTIGGTPRSPDIQAEEDANILACGSAAIKAGYTFEQTEECEDGELKCPLCPWASYRRETK